MRDTVTDCIAHVTRLRGIGEQMLDVNILVQQISVVQHTDLFQGSLRSDNVEGRRMRPWWFHKSSFVVATFRFDEMGEDMDGSSSFSLLEIAALDVSCDVFREALRLAHSFAAAY